jgi:hypothetical protein
LTCFFGIGGKTFFYKKRFSRWKTGIQIAVTGGIYSKFARTNIKNLKSLPYIRVEDNIMKNRF